MNQPKLDSLKAHALQKVKVARGKVADAEAVTRQAREELRAAEAVYNAVRHAESAAYQANQAFSKAITTAENASLEVDLDTELELLAAIATTEDVKPPKKRRPPAWWLHLKTVYYEDKEDIDHFFWMGVIFLGIPLKEFYVTI